jgi:hypothetical protein
MTKSLTLTIFYLLLSLARTMAAIPESYPTQERRHPLKEFISKRSGQVSAHWAVTVPDSLDNEPPSKMARTAVWLMVGSYVGSIVLGNLFMPIAYLGLAGILAANILAIIVLARKPNRKSRRLARIVLIITGVMIAATLALIGAINLLFPGAI